MVAGETPLRPARVVAITPPSPHSHGTTFETQYQKLNAFKHNHVST